MILKMQTRVKNDCEAWEFYDNIYNVNVHFDKNLGDPVVSILTEHLDAPINLVITECAYLLSDKGYIIERIGAIHQDLADDDKKEIPNEVR